MEVVCISFYTLYPIYTSNGVLTVSIFDEVVYDNRVVTVEVYMSDRKIVPIGKENFKDLIENNYYFVDKSLLIKDIIDRGNVVNIFTRPRRFGKTLNLSMLQYYFEKTSSDDSYLFDGLKISEAGDKYKGYQSNHPVISLSFKDLKRCTFYESVLQLKNTIIDEFDRYELIIRSSSLSADIYNEFMRFLNDEADVNECGNGLKFLSDCLYKVYGTKVVILIDEYDIVLENARQYGFYNDMLLFMQSFYKDVFDMNSSLEFSVMMGYLRGTANELFKNTSYTVNVHSLIFSFDEDDDNNFNKYFGFTTSEVEGIMGYYGLDRYIDEVLEEAYYRKISQYAISFHKESCMVKLIHDDGNKWGMCI